MNNNIEFDVNPSRDPQIKVMSKHTPGPWVVNDFCTVEGADTAIWTSHDPHIAKSICECHFETHDELERGETGCNQLEAEANAKLIAAAPELLEKLDQLTLVVGLTAFKHEDQRAVLQQAMDEARAAIDKATK